MSPVEPYNRYDYARVFVALGIYAARGMKKFLQEFYIALSLLSQRHDRKVRFEREARESIERITSV